MKALWTSLSVFGLVIFCSQAQTFRNLGFEQANVSGNIPPYGFLDWNLAVPGWSHSAGNDTSKVFYGEPHAGPTQYFLLVDRFSSLHQPLQLTYSLAFASGHETSSFDSTWVNAFISQTALIPNTAQSLRFLATGPFAVSINNNVIATYSFGNDSYGVDVSAYAGTISDLKVINTSGQYDYLGPVVVDGFSFSSTPVPEPRAIWLLGGALVFALLPSPRLRPSRGPLL